MDASSIRLNDVYGDRTDEDGHDNIEFYTGKENLAKPVMISEWENMYGGKFEIFDHGIDNSGGAISREFDGQPGYKRKDYMKPDWLVRNGDKERKVEVLVQAYHPYKPTSFKKSKIEYCMEHDSWIIVVRNTCWLLVDRARAKVMCTLKTAERHRGFGGKLAFIFPPEELMKWIKTDRIRQRYYCAQAAAKMRDIEAELFRAKSV